MEEGNGNPVFRPSVRPNKVDKKETTEWKLSTQIELNMGEFDRNVMKVCGQSVVECGSVKNN